jgi:hypothetical protein
MPRQASARQGDGLGKTDHPERGLAADLRQKTHGRTTLDWSTHSGTAAESIGGEKDGCQRPGNRGCSGQSAQSSTTCPSRPLLDLGTHSTLHSCRPRSGRLPLHPCTPGGLRGHAVSFVVGYTDSFVLRLHKSATSRRARSGRSTTHSSRDHRSWCSSSSCPRIAARAESTSCHGRSDTSPPRR